MNSITIDDEANGRESMEFRREQVINEDVPTPKVNEVDSYSCFNGDREPIGATVVPAEHEIRLDGRRGRVDARCCHFAGRRYRDSDLGRHRRTRGTVAAGRTDQPRIQRTGDDRVRAERSIPGRDLGERSAGVHRRQLRRRQGDIHSHGTG